MEERDKNQVRTTDIDNGLYIPTLTTHFPTFCFLLLNILKYIINGLSQQSNMLA